MTAYRSVEEMFVEMKKNRSVWQRFVSNHEWLRWLIYNAKDVPFDFYRKCKRGWQRAYRGWADEDTWDLDSYLAKIIKESITYLKVYKHGYPPDLTEEEWNYVLQDIIYTFDRIDAENKLDVVFIDQERFERGWVYFKRYYHNLWD